MNVIVLFTKLLMIVLTESRHVNQKCWSNDTRLAVGLYHNFSYQLLFVNEKDAVELMCRECNASDPHDVVVYWRKVDISLNRTDAPQPLNKQMKSLNSDMKILDSSSLHIKNVQAKHSGLYNCYLNSSSKQFQSSLTTPFETYSYFLHVSNPKNLSMNGTYAEWNYYEDSVYKAVQSVIHSNHSVMIANQTFKPSLMVHWTEWGHCLCGKYVFDTRSYRHAYCCIKLFDGLILPCQSTALKEIHPFVARIVGKISKFKEYRRCMEDCIPAAEEIGGIDFKFQKTIYLRESSNREFICLEPNSSTTEVNSTDILWIRDDDELLSNSKNAPGKSGEERRVAVDSFNTLYLTDVTMKEEGYYSCFDNGLPIAKILIRIEPHDLIFTKECGQKLFILTCVLVVWIVIYFTLECIKFRENAKLKK